MRVIFKLHRLMMSIVILSFIAVAATAGGHGGHPGELDTDIHEVFVRPLPDPQDGWVLRYTNTATHRDAVDATTFIDVHAGRISWEINRTTNIYCDPNGDHQFDPMICADGIEVTAPPGYIAVPSSALVVERERIDILIVPELLG